MCRNVKFKDLTYNMNINYLLKIRGQNKLC